MEILAMIQTHSDTMLEEEQETGGKRQRQEAKVAKTKLASPKKLQLAASKAAAAADLINALTPEQS